MVVQDHANGARLRVVLIEFLEQQDEFAATVARMNLCEDFAGVQVDGSENGQGPMALVLVVPTPDAVLPWHRRQIGRGSLNRLNARFLVPTSGNDRTGILAQGCAALARATSW